MDAITITEVAPRDGLQNQSIYVPAEAKIQFATMLFDAGVQEMEVTSFVSPKAVPQMRDATEVLTGLSGVHPTGRKWVLVPNLKGVEHAKQAGATSIAVVLAASDTMNWKNINMSLETAESVVEETIGVAKAGGMRVRAYVAVAFHCPFEGKTHLDTAMRLAQRLMRAGADQIVFADTIGGAAPIEVESLVAQCKGYIPLSCVGMHFHNTRGMGVANAWAAMNSGIRFLDSSAGGLGGCPFAPGAAGNVATEDLLVLAQQSGFQTGINLVKLELAIRFIEEQLGKTLGGPVLAWHRSRGG